jgi:hypothetical protein
MVKTIIEEMRSKIPKIVKNEMEYFPLVRKEYPLLSKYEEQIADEFKRHYHSLIDLVFDAHEGKLYAHNLVINGAILRSLNTYRGANWALGKRNPHILFNCLRSQCETLALSHYCVLKPEYVETATLGKRGHPAKRHRIVKIGKMIRELDKKFNGIGKDYSDLCELVHPNPASLYANIQPIAETERKLIIIGTTSTRMPEGEAETAVRMLIFWTDWLLKELSKLALVFGAGATNNEGRT